MASLAVVFIALAVVAHRAHAGTNVDHTLLAWIIAHRTPTITAAAAVVTQAFSPMVIVGVAVLAGVVLGWRRSWLLGAAVVVTVAAAGSAGAAVKSLVGAARPPRGAQVIAETGHGFPSGHVTGTVALTGILAFVLGRTARTAIRAALGVGAVLVVGVVAATRLYLGVHWLSDVVGGLLLGSITVVLATAVLVAVLAADGSVEDIRAAPGHLRVT